jgi:hypothetical protein
MEEASFSLSFFSSCTLLFPSSSSSSKEEEVVVEVRVSLSSGVLALSRTRVESELDVKKKNAVDAHWNELRLRKLDLEAISNDVTNLTQEAGNSKQKKKNKHDVELPEKEREGEGRASRQRKKQKVDTSSKKRGGRSRHEGEGERSFLHE